MQIRRRIERLERNSPPTIANLIDRIDREAMNALSQDQQRIVNRGMGHSAGDVYQAALASALRQVSDEDLDRMLLFYKPNTSRSEASQ